MKSVQPDETDTERRELERYPFFLLSLLPRLSCPPTPLLHFSRENESLTLNVKNEMETEW
jgi:hypothetical protein